MRALPLLLLSVGCAGELTGDGNVIEEERETQYFRSISIEGPIAATLHGSAEERKVVVRADGNVQEFISTDVLGSVLELRTERAIGEATTEVELWSPSIEGIYHDGTALVEAFTLATPGLEIVGSSNARLVAHGSLLSSDVVTSGNAEVDLSDLETEAVHLEHRASKTLTVWATVSVDGVLTGTGDLVVKGQPETRDVTASGSGTVTYE